MDKETKDTESFASGKELLEMCIKKLNENQQGKTGGNRALYPTIIIFMGEKSRKYLKEIKRTLDDNWDNAGFLQYINVLKQGEGYQSYRATDIEKRNEGEWDTSCSEGFEVSLNKAITEMLEKEDKIFGDKTCTKMEFILDSTETEAEAYYKFFTETKTKMLINHLKTMFIMLDQRPTEECMERSHYFLRYLVTEKREHTVYLISNYMKSGTLLGDDRIWQNYRLISNIMLLGGNKGQNIIRSEQLFSGLKTVSYVLLTKPTDEIARASLKALMNRLHSFASEKNKKVLTEKEIKGKLKISNINGIEWAEELYREKILIKLPRENVLEYLPFQKRDDMKEIQKEKNLTSELAEHYTMGVWHCFMERNYIQVVKNYFALKENEEYIEELIHSQIQKEFSYFDLLALKNETLSEVLKEKYISQLGKRDNDWTKKLHLLGINESKRIFYDYIKELLQKQLIRLSEIAEKYEEGFKQYWEEIKKESDKVGGEEKTIMDFYRKTVNEFVDECGEKYASELFEMPAVKEDILKRIGRIYLKLIEREVYVYDFEGDMDNRLSMLSPEKKHMFVQDELQKNLSGSIRLKTVMEPSVRKVCCYYLINESAKYAKELQKKEGFGVNFMLYNLNRTDSIEQMEIYDIEKPELLYLMEEENK